MTFFSDLALLLKSIPALVKLISEMASWVRTTFGDNPEKFMLDSAEVFRRINDAKTPQEKQALASDISRLIRRL